MIAQRLSANALSILACPACAGALTQRDRAFVCTMCGVSYPMLDDGQIDMRLKSPKQASVDFELGTALLENPDFEFNPISLNSSPAIDLTKVDIPWHLTRQLVSHFPKAESEKSLMLDLGSGRGIHRQTVEEFGFEWIGLDYKLPEAPIRGDAHAPPFQDASFEFILSIAVLEHIQFPFVMTQEAYRVLQPGGFFIGTVSFLEPFHNDSYYHHSHLGAYNSLRNAGFDVLELGPSPGWPALYAISEMALFRMMPAALTRLLAFPLQLLHRIWWALGYAVSRTERASEHYRQLSTSGAFTFIARKPK